MNALELKHKIKSADNSTTFLKLLAFSTLVTLVIFPLNLWLNPDVDPIIYEHPYLLGFGFIAFVLVCMVAFVGGSIFTLMILDSYLIISPKILDSTRKTVSNLISKDEDLLDRWTDGILFRTARHYKEYDDPKIESLQNQIIEKDTRINELKNLILPHIARQNRNSYDQNLRITKLEETVQEIKELLENKTPENSISVEEFVRLSERLFKVEEELRNLKGE